MKQTSGHITWEWVEHQLTARRSIWLGTTRPDGRPHSAPVWFVWEDEAAWFATSGRTQKGVNLRHQDHVVLSAGDGDDVIVIEGRAEVVGDPAGLAGFDRALGAKYVDPPTGARASAALVGDTTYRVTPDHVMAWVYGDVSGRADWHRTSSS